MQANVRLGIYSCAHFLVDFSCALLLLGRVCPEGDAVVCLLLYNFFAFAVQMPVGLLADHLNQNRRVAATGCLAVLLAWLLPGGLPSAVMAGLGNALFHVGGGLDTLGRSQTRAGALGIFVSPGAGGLFLGGQLVGRVVPLAMPVCLLLLGTAVTILLWCRGPLNGPVQFPERETFPFMALVYLLLVVILRSWTGMLFQFPWRGEWGVALACGVVLGKAAGGLLSDRFGLRRTAGASLLLAAVCLLFSDWAFAGLAGVFLFNMTMPLTLWAAARLLPGSRGLAFGLLTFGLFLGFLPSHLGWQAASPGPVVYALSALLSLPPLLYGLDVARKGERQWP